MRRSVLLVIPLLILSALFAGCGGRGAEEPGILVRDLGEDRSPSIIEASHACSVDEAKLPIDYEVADLFRIMGNEERLWIETREKFITVEPDLSIRQLSKPANPQCSRWGQGRNGALVCQEYPSNPGSLLYYDENLTVTGQEVLPEPTRDELYDYCPGGCQRVSQHANLYFPPTGDGLALRYDRTACYDEYQDTWCRRDVEILSSSSPQTAWKSMYYQSSSESNELGMIEMPLVAVFPDGSLLLSPAKKESPDGKWRYSFVFINAEGIQTRLAVLDGMLPPNRYELFAFKNNYLFWTGSGFLLRGWYRPGEDGMNQYYLILVSQEGNVELLPYAPEWQSNGNMAATTQGGASGVRFLDVPFRWVMKRGRIIAPDQGPGGYGIFVNAPAIWHFAPEKTGGVFRTQWLPMPDGCPEVYYPVPFGQGHAAFSSEKSRYYDDDGIEHNSSILHLYPNVLEIAEVESDQTFHAKCDPVWVPEGDGDVDEGIDGDVVERDEEVAETDSDTLPGNNGCSTGNGSWCVLLLALGLLARGRMKCHRPFVTRW